jgi:1-acyl-sn-glycerol-3-phosphate acyltransferase
VTLTYAIARIVFTPLVAFYFCIGGRGRPGIPRRGGLIIVANHTSYLDPVLLAANAPRPLHFLARESLFRRPLFGWLLRRVHSIPLARDRPDRAALERALKTVRAGGALVIFPEGTRSRDGRLGPALAGVGHIALRAGIPIVAAHIDGAHQAMPRGTKFPRPRRVRIRWGTPQTVDQWLGASSETDVKKERKSVRIVSALMKELACLGGQKADTEDNKSPPMPQPEEA